MPLQIIYNLYENSTGQPNNFWTEIYFEFSVESPLSPFDGPLTRQTAVLIVPRRQLKLPKQEASPCASTRSRLKVECQIGGDHVIHHVVGKWLTQHTTKSAERTTCKIKTVPLASMSKKRSKRNRSKLPGY